ncbi:MAG: hypothetical protein ACD_81C00143G0004 [uncultured bacterium]|uniref:Uncharacterized protein n=2 Tax=Candidatus Wolfeibacteriota TaxID=1752735 RepID=A0A0G1H792_9BACT|nr:MAG: hypothetical protein ACD_81C00143G0004 [uncultured bacterium]KKR12338.1 MAG: hypothetical protein UT41_C0002G0112 [Candidatus Wolfebacteria bacterium GW2011_GWC2_39_22]KKT43246.1 MAG: hypothetical protein UW32_C0002G0107 [Candidatus Wolfebacteria bacterium GW2011_GWE2_44_13]HBI25966.1 hypothetical protein [Candidatus Wolfebacteria bacterium]
MIKTEACPCCAGKKKVERNVYGLPPNEDMVTTTVEVGCEMCSNQGTIPVMEMCFTCGGEKKFFIDPSSSICSCEVKCPTCKGNGYVERGARNKEGGLLNRIHKDALSIELLREHTTLRCRRCDNAISKREDYNYRYSNDNPSWWNWD